LTKAPSNTGFLALFGPYLLPWSRGAVYSLPVTIDRVAGLRLADVTSSPAPRSLMWEKIRNARLFRVLGVYLGAAWVVLQITDTLQSGVGLPDWVMPYALVLLSVGLVVVLATALVQAGLSRIDEGKEGSGSWAIDLKGLVESLSHGRMPRMTWGRILLGGTVAFSLLFGAAGVYVLITGDVPSLPLVAEAEAASQPGFAVLPFRVTGAGGDLDLWREGMVDLLSTNLEGVAGFRKIDPTAIISRWRRAIGEGKDAPSSEAAVDVARDLGAWYALTGTLIASGQQVRATVEVYDIRTDQVLGTAQADGSPEDLLGIVDRLSLEVLRAGLVPIEGDLPQFDISRITTTSLDALRAYLRGEQLYRRSRWPDAAEAFEEAIAADSTFAMAWYRRGLAHGWQRLRHGAGGALTRESIARAVELSDRLQDRERLLVEGYAMFGRGDPAAFGVFEELTRRYPDDVEGWAILGDAYVHMGGVALLPADRFRDALGRAIELNPYFGPAYVHLIEDSFSRWDSVGTRALIDDFARIDAETPVCGDFEWAYAMLWGDETARAEAVTVLEREGTARPACSLIWLPATPRFLGDLTRSYDELRERGVPQDVGPLGVAVSRAGRVHDARRLWATDPVSAKFDARSEAYSTALYYADPAVGAEVEAALAEDPDYADRFWLAVLEVDRGDAAGAERWLEATRAAVWELPAEPEQAYLDILLPAYADATAGYVAIKRGELESGAAAIGDALDRMVEAGVGGWPHSVLRFELGKALLELNRPQEAAKYFSTFNYLDFTLPTRSWLYLGHAYAAMDEPQTARDYYELFVEAWSQCEPELVPLREEAEAGLARLEVVPEGP